jgi:hypothetical protein
LHVEPIAFAQRPEPGFVRDPVGDDPGELFEELLET